MRKSVKFSCREGKKIFLKRNKKHVESRIALYYNKPKLPKNDFNLREGFTLAREHVQTDMTAGSPMKIILNFTIPIFIGNMFQQLYSMADTVIVGKFVGTKALAAVGSVGTIMFLILGFLQGLTAGFSVLTAQRFGAGDMDGMRKTVGTAAVLSLGITVVMTAGSMLTMKPLLVFMHTPDDIFQDAYAYIMIICAGIAATVLYNLLSGILRALGDSKTPLDFIGGLKCRAGFAADYCISYGGGWRSLCYRDFPGSIRYRVSAVYYKKSAAFEAAQRRLSGRPVYGENAAGYRAAYGAAVFYYSHWNHDGAVCSESAGLYVRGSLYCG